MPAEIWGDDALSPDDYEGCINTPTSADWARMLQNPTFREYWLSQPMPDFLKRMPQYSPGWEHLTEEERQRLLSNK